MTFYDPTLYGRDEEEEFGDSGAYSESLEEDFEEEEEEEEEPGITGSDTTESDSEPAPAPPAPRPVTGGGGGDGVREANGVGRRGEEHSFRLRGLDVSPGDRATRSAR